MKPKYFIVCTPEQLKNLVIAENPLVYAFHNDLAIFDKSHVEYDQLCTDRELFHYKDQEFRKLKRTMRFKKVE